MARPSSISRQPVEVRELIGRLRDQGRTIDEILAKLGELRRSADGASAGVDVSRSALGRHVKQLDAIGEEIRRSRTIAEAMVQRFGDAPESKTARLNIELMHSLLMKLMVGEDGESVTLEAQDAYFAATALQRLGMASKAAVDTEVKIREKFKAEVEAKAKAAVAETNAELKKAGISAETIKRIETEILGIAR